ncbi:MAG: hypothetical protein ABIW31_01140 [Novosphingobium sp.]
MASDNLLISGTTLLGTAIIAITMLRGWTLWLKLKLRELEQARPELESGLGNGAARIELADLKERIRKLEAIAAGVDL